jgi:hypothetical protein
MACNKSTCVVLSAHRSFKGGGGGIERVVLLMNPGRKEKRKTEQRQQKKCRYRIKQVWVRLRHVYVTLLPRSFFTIRLFGRQKIGTFEGT